jgi:hypothetical protein
MRAIKFRGKIDAPHVDSRHGQWIEGYFLKIDGKPYIYEPHTELGGSGSSPVDPATVGQFTGLLDKNGKKIYEGDIIRFIDAGENTWEKAIEWSEECAEYVIMGRSASVIRYENTTRWMIENFKVDGLFEVIGNIHDNSDYLKTNSYV